MVGVLSGIEINDAVKRQHRYIELCNKKTTNDGGLGIIDSFRLWRLSRQPRIWIDNFNNTPSDLGGQLNPNSYNVNLAEDLLVYSLPPLKPEIRYSPMLATEQLDDFALDVKKDNPTKKLKIPKQGLILLPDRLYLGRTIQHTESFNLRPCIDGRSSIGRLGIFIHATAGYGDIGFCGCWVLEIMVVHPVKIYPNMSIGQISYTPVSLRHRPYQSNKYQNQKGIVASKMWMENGDSGCTTEDGRYNKLHANTQLKLPR